MATFPLNYNYFLYLYLIIIFVRLQINIFELYVLGVQLFLKVVCSHSTLLGLVVPDSYYIPRIIAIGLEEEP